MIKVIENLCALQECLGGNTTPVQTNSPEVFAFDDCHIHTQLGGANSCNITAGAAAYYDQIKIHWSKC